MPETPTAAALVIPDKAVFALDTADRSSLLTSIDSVIAIAAPVVAAELRRIADQISADVDGYNEGTRAELEAGSWDVIRQLRDRADELDPPAKET